MMTKIGNWKCGWKVARVNEQGAMFSCSLTAEPVKYGPGPVYRPTVHVSDRRAIQPGPGYVPTAWNRKVRECGPLSVFTNLKDAMCFLVAMSVGIGHTDPPARGAWYYPLRRIEVIPCVYQESLHKHLWCWLKNGKQSIDTMVPPGTAFADVVVMLPSTEIIGPMSTEQPAR